MGFFQDLFTNKPAKDAAAKAAADRQRGVTAATGYLEPAYGKATDYLSTAQERFMPLLDTATSGYNKYASLVGAGPEGAAGIGDTLKGLPGYQFALDQAMEAVKRNQASTGALASGDTWTKLGDRAQQVANQNYGQYAQLLAPYLQLAPGITQQVGQYDVGKAGLQTDLATKLAGLVTGQWNANAESDASAELARAGAAKNVFDAVMGVAKLAMSAATGMPSFGLGGGGGGQTQQSFWNAGNVGPI